MVLSGADNVSVAVQWHEHCSQHLPHAHSFKTEYFIVARPALPPEKLVLIPEFEQPAFGCSKLPLELLPGFKTLECGPQRPPG